jgi:hypothetical protein
MNRQVPGSHPATLPKESRSEMLLAVAIILAILWCILFFAVHVTSFAIHIVIILAVISLIAHLFTGKRVA